MNTIHSISDINADESNQMRQIDIFLLIRDMVVKRWNRQFGCETIHPTQKFTSMNLLQMTCVITRAQKKFSLQPKKKGRFFKKNFSNWDFDLEISHLRKKVFMPTSKM